MILLVQICFLLEKFGGFFGKFDRFGTLLHIGQILLNSACLFRIGPFCHGFGKVETVAVVVILHFHILYVFFTIFYVAVKVALLLIHQIIRLL